MKNIIIFSIFVLSLSTIFYASGNLTSCVGCSQVTCPAGAVCHNVGSCPNGFVLWGCEYPNGTVVSTALPSFYNLTTSSLSTTIRQNNTKPILTTTLAPITTTIIQSQARGSNINEIVIISLVLIIIVVALAYYIFVSRKKLSA
jgi:hypothetical protein